MVGRVVERVLVIGLWCYKLTLHALHTCLDGDVYIEARLRTGSFVGLVDSGTVSSSCSVSRIASFFRCVPVIWKAIVNNMLDECSLLVMFTSQRCKRCWFSYYEERRILLQIYVTYTCNLIQHDSIDP